MKHLHFAFFSSPLWFHCLFHTSWYIELAVFLPCFNHIFLLFQEIMHLYFLSPCILFPHTVVVWHGGTGIRHVKWHAFTPSFLQGCCRQIPAVPRKQSCGLVYEYYSWANFSCGRNAGNALADNTIFLAVSQRKANVHYGSSELLCSWYISPFCLKGEIVSSSFPALLPPRCHLLPLSKYCVPQRMHAPGLACGRWRFAA